MNSWDVTAMVKSWLKNHFAIFWSISSHILSIHLQMINQGYVYKKTKKLRK